MLAEKHVINHIQLMVFMNNKKYHHKKLYVMYNLLYDLNISNNDK